MNQSEKAELFRNQHHGDKILLLPNVWDPLTARLVAGCGFGSLATASFSVAAVNGYKDGERIPFDLMVAEVAKITSAVDVPVSVDFERGYSSDLATLAGNTKRLIDAGAIAINLEDRSLDSRELVSISEQMEKIRTIRETGQSYGVNIFINARTDACLLKQGDYLNETIKRGNAYQNAGADGFYPVLIDNYTDIEKILANVSLPVNVLLMKPIGDLTRLARIGVKRVSLGPGTLKYVLTKMQSMLKKLSLHDTTDFFSQELISSDEVMKYADWENS